MPLLLLTLGLIAQDDQFSHQLHTVGQIDVTFAFVWLIFLVLAAIASIASN